MIQNIKDLGNLTVLLGCDIIRNLVGINCTFNDEVIDRYVSFLKTLVMRLKDIPHLLPLFYDSKLKNYPLFIQAMQFANHTDSLNRTAVQTIALTLLRCDIDNKEYLFEHMPCAQYFINTALTLRDYWLSIDKLAIDNDPAKAGVMAGMIEDAGEYMDYIQDAYEVLEEHKPYADMMTRCLLRVFYLPVVLQSLCVMSVKPKLQAHTSLYILTQSVLKIKYEPLLTTLIELTLGKEISTSHLAYLNKTDLWESPLYSQGFKYTHHLDYTKVQAAASFAYTSNAQFESYLAMVTLKKSKSDFASFKEFDGQLRKVKR